MVYDTRFFRYSINKANDYAKSYGYDLFEWDDYEQVQHNATLPVIGRIYDVRRQELSYNENKKYWSDYSKNAGFDLDKVSYPIRSGVYGSQVGIGDYFEASASVVNQFTRRLYKW